MTTGTPPPTLAAEEPDPDAQRTRRRQERMRAQRRRRIAGVAAGGALVLLAAVALGSGDGIPSKVRVGDVDVSGLSDAQARERLETRAADLERRRISLRTASGEYTQRVSAGVLVGDAEIDEALARAKSARSRIGRALARFGIAGTKKIPLTFAVQDDAIDRIVRDTEAKLGRRAVPATVKVDGTEIVTTPAKAGRAVNRKKLAAQIAVLPDTVEVPVEDTRPGADDDDATTARTRALRVIAHDQTVTLGEVSATLTPVQLRKALRFPEQEGAIAVVLAPEVLRAVLRKPLNLNEGPPTDARFEIRGERVVVIPSKPGRRLGAKALSAAIVADPDAATHTASVVVQKADFTTAEAKALGIKERVSSFTTPFACCPPRVTNIRRAGQILDGTIIKAGERFSLNDALGERTAARGFVLAPAIAAGELKDSYGGGVSQVATTTYNAAFFAGLALEQHTPHEFWISRYPMGREATISWRSPDLVFRNDWDAAILVAVGVGSNGITVSFYSSKLGRRVETTAGTPTNRTEPKKIERQNPDLPPGTKKVIQEQGSGGFAISYTRKVYRDGKLIKDETFRWNYRPENSIVELGPPLPDTPEPDPSKPPTDTPPAKPPTTSTPGGGGGTTTTGGGGAPPPPTP